MDRQTPDRLRAVANLIERPPLDDVMLEKSVALQHAADLRAILALPQGEAEPIPMVLHCPKCGEQHIDEPEPSLGPRFCDPGRHDEWTNPPHRSHLCHGCGHIWRPADVPTTGVAAVQTVGKADSPITSPSPPAPSREAVFREITMQDVRLAVGEGPLKPADVLAGCNAEMRRRQYHPSPPAPSRVSVDDNIVREVRFLLDRLTDFEVGLDEPGALREFHGHVAPSAARLRAALVEGGE